MERKRVKVGDYEVMTYSVGTGPEVLLVMHGGPGAPCSYVRDAHICYVEQGFRVVSWDQLGCGESDQPDDTSLWTVPRYVEEVETVRRTLGLGCVFLLGNSWGGILGLEYCIAYPENVVCFVAGNIGFDMALLQQGFVRVKRGLGEETQRMMALRESEGTTEHPEYQAAATLLLYRHMCRTEVWPQPVIDSMNNIGHGPWDTMFGPQMFNCTGSLRNYNRIEDLPDVHTPTLITASEHDYLLPEIVVISRDYMPNAEYTVFRGCAHMPFWEDPETYHKAVGGFLEKHR